MSIIKGVAIRIVFIAILLLLIPGIISSPVIATAIAVTPSNLEISDALRGGEYERKITVYNPDSEQTDYTLAASGDAGEWISFYKQDDSDSMVNRVTIPGNENVRLLVKFTIPQDAANGEHNAVISVTSVPVEEAPGVSGHAVSLAAPVSVTIFVTGNQILSGVVTSINADDVEVNYPLRIKVHFQNTGNVVAIPQTTVEITTQDGIAINQYISDDFSVKPQKHETIPIEWDTTGRDPGDYIADVSVALGDTIIKQEKLSFSILPLGTITRSGNLMELKFRGETAQGILTTVQATFINTGQIDTKAKFVGKVYHNDTLINTLESEELLVAVGNTEILEAYFKPVQPGEYRVNGYVLYEGKKTEEKESSFTISRYGEAGDAVGTALNNVGKPEQALDFYIIAGAVAVAMIMIVIIFTISRRHRLTY